MASQTTISRECLLSKLSGTGRMPTIPVILLPLLRYMELPIEQLDLQKITDVISQDNSLVGQCLHMANSPLYGRSQPVDSVKGAVMTLGMARMREIAVSCSLMQLLPGKRGAIDPTAFWAHSLGCALVSRYLAQKIKYCDPEKAYLAGLLHDLGIVANLFVAPEEFRIAHALARQGEVSLYEAEKLTLGFSHCDSGLLLAQRWKLPEDLTQTLGFHHDPHDASSHQPLVAIVHLADLLCRMRNLGYGFDEHVEISLVHSSALEFLIDDCPGIITLDWERFTYELDNYLLEVQRLVSLVYKPS